MATVTTRQGDTWDILSKRIWGDEHYMQKLIAANIQHRKVVLFPYGVVLNVPDVAVSASGVSDSLPPWKRP